MTVTVRLHGTRGSIPVPTIQTDEHARIKAVLKAAVKAGLSNPGQIDDFIESGADGALPTVYGGNTACVEVDGGNGDRLICDCGTGIRSVGAKFLATPADKRPKEFHILMSHVHWDHIMGFPFFVPAYIPGMTINIYGCHTEIEAAFRAQHAAPSFPIDFSMLGATIRFHTLHPEERAKIAGFSVTTQLEPHGGDSYAYRIEREGKAVVYATDAEHKPHLIGPQYPFVDFIKDADLLVFDAQYSFAESVSLKEDWGHSSNTVGVELAQFGGVKHLILFHHEPNNTDAMLDKVLADTIRFEELTRTGEKVRVSGGHDGMVIRL